MERKGTARDLERFIGTHVGLAQTTMDILGDESLTSQLRAPAAAAAWYGYEDNDLVHDDFPAYGLIDDLFVLAIGLSAVLQAGGEAALAYAQRDVQGATLEKLVAEMKELFPGFWEYCRKASFQFFTDVVDGINRDKAMLDDTRERFREEIDDLGKKTSDVQLNEEEVEVFLSQFDRFEPGDLVT